MKDIKKFKIIPWEWDKSKGKSNKYRYSFVPTSIWEISEKNSYLQKLINDEDENREVKRTGGALGEKGYKFSEFKPSVAYRIIEYWGEEAKTVLDPFAGRYTRMVVSLYLGKSYIGFDVVKDYIDNNIRRYEDIKENFPDQFVKLYVSDGCIMNEISDNSYDFIFTCPPYYNLEIYKESSNQLSRLKTYDDFLLKMGQTMDNSFRVLKNGSFAVFVVADWHKKGKFYCFHNDLINLGIKSGFDLYEIVINKVFSPFIAISASQNKRFKWMGKAHEYILVFKKIGK